MVQEKLAWMIREITKAQLLAVQNRPTQDAKKIQRSTSRSAR